MSLVTEKTKGAHFITGSVDSKRLIPLRLQGTICSCNSEMQKQVLSLNKDLEVEEVKIKLVSKETLPNFEELAKVIESAIEKYKSTREAVIINVIPKCFWGMAACAAAALACVLSTAGWGSNSLFSSTSIM